MKKNEYICLLGLDTKKYIPPFGFKDIITYSGFHSSFTLIPMLFLIICNFQWILLLFYYYKERTLECKLHMYPKFYNLNNVILYAAGFKTGTLSEFLLFCYKINPKHSKLILINRRVNFFYHQKYIYYINIFINGSIFLMG